MTLKTRLANLEKKNKGSDKIIIAAIDDSSDPNYVTVTINEEEKCMTQAEFMDLKNQLGEDVTILHIVYKDSKPANTDNEIVLPGNGRD